MRNPMFTGIFLITSLLGASSCAGELDEVDSQSSEAMIGLDDGSFADEAIPIDDTKTLLQLQTCTPGNICLWAQPLFSGPKMFSTAQAGCVNLPPAANNKTSSWWNRHASSYRLYEGGACTGQSVIAPAGLANPNMVMFNKQVSSLCRGPNCPS
jgi:hypothetical protein